MQKANGSWTKVSAVTMLLCLCLGAAYGWHSVQFEKPEDYRRAHFFDGHEDIRKDMEAQQEAATWHPGDDRIYPAPYPQYRGVALPPSEARRWLQEQGKVTEQDKLFLQQQLMEQQPNRFAKNLRGWLGSN
jgi:hypothetical protein